MEHKFRRCMEGFSVVGKGPIVLVAERQRGEKGLRVTYSDLSMIGLSGFIPALAGEAFG